MERWYIPYSWHTEGKGAYGNEWFYRFSSACPSSRKIYDDTMRWLVTSRRGCSFFSDGKVLPLKWYMVRCADFLNVIDSIVAPIK